MLISVITACGRGPEEQLVENTPIPTSFPESYDIGIPPYIPEYLTSQLSDIHGIELSTSLNAGSIRLDVSSDAPFFEWVYVLTAPFSYIGGGVSGADLKAFWQGKDVVGFPAEKIFIDGSTRAVIEKIWGGAATTRITTTTAKDLSQKTWDAENAFAILPFEDLKPSWQVVQVDGTSPIRKDFNTAAYILNIPFSFLGNKSDVDDLVQFISENHENGGSISNRNADQMTTVVMTGVTALVRGTAYIMEASGFTYPAIDIGDILRDADILHISNEVPFTENCPDPFASKTNDSSLVFCSKPEYFQLLEAIGTDVVELTGDHFRDWGPDAILNTLEMINQRGWQYYGGGQDLEDAIQPAEFIHNGNKIAFIGCNAKPPGYATASATSPGAVHCDLEVMAQQVRSVLERGYQPIFTFQHVEYYTYDASPALQVDFYTVADAGAVIVSGSQAHQPHAFEFYKSSFLHYGLGNLFFDQYGESFSQRQAFIDRHVLYNGRHVSTELIPVMFIDMARPRLMTEDERVDLLNTVFTASGW